MPSRKKPAKPRASKQSPKKPAPKMPARKTPAKSANKSAGPSPLARVSAATLPALRSQGPRIAIAGLAIVVGIGIVLGVGALHTRAQHWIQTGQDTIHIGWPSSQTPGAALDPAAPDAEVLGTWMPQQVRDDLVATVRDALGEDRSPFQHDNLRRAAAALERTGWLEAQATARRRTGDIIEISGTWRVPAAVVRLGDTDYMVDWNARRLPLNYPADLRDPANFRTDLANQSLRRIIGAPGPLPRTRDGKPDYQTPWPGEPVEAALALLQEIRAEPYYAQVAAIDVSQFRARSGMLIIITDRGTTIEWGHRPDIYRDEPVSPEEKLLRLRRLYTQPGINHIDGGTSGCRLYTPEIDCPPPTG